MKKIHIHYFIFIIIGYLSLKVFCLYYYDINNIKQQNIDNFTNGINFIDGINIVEHLNIKNKVLSNDEYLVFNEIKIQNAFEDFVKHNNFEKNKNNYVSYTLNKYNDNKLTLAYFNIEINDSYIDMFKDNIQYMYAIKDYKISNFDIINILNKNNINNDIRLFEYLEKIKTQKNNIFTSITKIQEEYVIAFLSSLIFPPSNNIVKIDGPYKGYLFNFENAKIIEIFKNNKRYTFTFTGLDYFTDDYVKELLKTIVIDDI